MAISYRDTHQSGCSYIRCDFGDERTNRLNEADGVFLNFTKRYHDIRVAAHDLDKRVQTNPSPLDEGDAHQIYFQLFGLIYDEINAYQNNFLDKEVLVGWLTWQIYDYIGGEIKFSGGMNAIPGCCGRAPPRHPAPAPPTSAKKLRLPMT